MSQPYVRKLLAAAAVAASTLLPFGAQAGEKVRIGYWTSGVSLGYGSVLQSTDFLAKRGIDAEFAHFPEVSGPIRALAAGSIDLAFGAPLAGVFSAAAEGVPVRIFLATQPADVQFVVPEDSPIRAIADLKGQKIGMSPAGSSVAAIAGAVLAGNHAIGANDFSLVGGNESRLVQFVAQKQVGAAALRSVTIEQLGDELKVRRLGSFADEWKKLTQSDTVPYIGVGTVRAQLADTQPETVAKVIAGLRDTLAWGRANPDEVVAILRQSANLPERDARVYVGLWDAMNRASFEAAEIDTLRRQHRVFSESGVVKGTLDESLFAPQPYALSKGIQ